MSSTLLEILKFNLQEKEYPYFEDSDLQLLLETNDNNVNKASYKGCLMKASADDKLEVSGVKLESNRSYWLTLAETFKPQKTYSYQTSMKRADGQ